MGVPPVMFDPVRGSNRVLKKLFKTESKVFSIYAEGVVPGTQREARVGSTPSWTCARPRMEPAAARSAGQWRPGQPQRRRAAHRSEFVNEWPTNLFGSIVYYRVD